MFYINTSSQVDSMLVRISLHAVMISDISLSSLCCFRCNIITNSPLGIILFLILNDRVFFKTSHFPMGVLSFFPLQCVVFLACQLKGRFVIIIFCFKRFLTFSFFLRLYFSSVNKTFYQAVKVQRSIFCIPAFALFLACFCSHTFPIYIFILPLYYLFHISRTTVTGFYNVFNGISREMLA